MFILKNKAILNLKEDDLKTTNKKPASRMNDGYGYITIVFQCLQIYPILVILTSLIPIIIAF